MLESQLRGRWASVDPLASTVRRLGCYRGIAELTGPDPGRRGRRLPAVRLGPGVHGIHRPDALGVLQRRAHPPGRHHQSRPKLNRGALIEAAWSYRHRPAIGATLKRRRAGCPAQTLARSWKAQQRLHATYAKLTRRGKIPSVAVTATARELAGFVWAEMTS